MRIADLFCGIGGVAEATRHSGDGPADTTGLAKVVAAIDIDRDVGPVYEANHGVTPQCRTLESVRSLPEADLWWLSPPCQPYTSRGRRRAEDDPRSEALGNLVRQMEQFRPAKIVLENVPQFASSNHHVELREMLIRNGYAVREDTLCPTQWGVPMRRNRFYLRACRDGRSPADVCPHRGLQPIAAYLDESAWDDPSLRLSAQHRKTYEKALHVVDADAIDSPTACFTSAYGKSVVQAGSYVRCRKREVIRRLSPQEISKLMGFRADFRWPAIGQPRRRYRLLGNSLAVAVVRSLIASMI